MNLLYILKIYADWIRAKERDRNCAWILYRTFGSIDRFAKYFQETYGEPWNYEPSHIKEEESSSIITVSSIKMSKSSLKELEVLTDDLCKSQSIGNADIESNGTITITSEPAIRSDYALSDKTETPNKFIQEDLELTSTFAGFIPENKEKTIINYTNKVKPQAVNQHDPHLGTQVGGSGTQHALCTPWQVAPEIIDHVMEVDSEVGTQPQSIPPSVSSPFSHLSRDIGSLEGLAAKLRRLETIEDKEQRPRRGHRSDERTEQPTCTRAQDYL
ncbi:hypothetical protein CROQUDRAFT_100289 [Cronartium quercuum f. sp. fusiforme G11]|uniref:Uncharacterized protein n=1 Tax=Cronartium quercuum f. sp. fusiforme G11 TaxID=708437 RepID=A0A9P6N6W8_9BASI|nr:hypothetical protein CROQUDRAFT_100289 [Cronartium quercuum f. sp. fusiforme G11]